MSKTIRRIIFYTLVLVFIVLGIGITLYAEGIRIDGKTFKFTNVGGMYILPSPSTATMTLDGKPLKRNSGIFQKGTLVNGLFPKNHTLELSADGYKPWKRTISVEPSKVSEVQHAVLVPERPLSHIGTNVTNFWLLQGFPLLQQNTSSYFFKDTPIPANSAPIAWGKNEFLTRSGSSYALVSVLDATSASLKPLLTKLGNEATASSTVVTLDAFNYDKLFVMTPHNLFLGDTNANSLTSIIKTTSTQLTAFAASDDSVAWSEFMQASGTSRIVLYDRFSRKTKLITETLPGKTTTLVWGDGTLLGILQQNGDLYIDETADTVKPARQSSNVRAINFTSDGSKLAILGSASLEVVSFTNDKYSRFNLQNISDIKNVVWYRNNSNLILEYPDRALLLDIDDGYQENIIQIASTTKSAYDGELNRFYYLDEEHTVQVLQFPKD